MAVKKEETKLYLVASPDSDWYLLPVEAKNEISAIEIADEDALESAQTEYDVYEVVRKEPQRFKSAIRVVPR